MAVRKRQKRSSKVDTTLRRKLKSYELTLIYTIGESAYVGDTRMIGDGGVFTSEDSSEEMWITSTMPPIEWIETYA